MSIDASDKWLFKALIILFLGVVFVLVFSSLYGCKSCEPEIVYQPYEVLVPVPVRGTPLPVPEPVACPPRADGWRGSAAYLKGCYEAALLKIEEYIHIIESHNKTIDATQE
jgi:hypothetical protein